MEFLFLVCQQLGCRQLSPSQGGKDACYMELPGSDFLGRHLPAFHLTARELESGFETTGLLCLAIPTASPGKPFPNVKTTQKKDSLGSRSSTSQHPSPRPPPEVVSPKCQVRGEADKAPKLPATSHCVSFRVVLRLGEGGK